MNFAAPYPSRHPTVFGGDMVATSHSLAAQAGLSMLARGGNAVDAERVTMPGHAYSLERIAASQGEEFYRGELAARMVAHAAAHGGALSADDLARHRADWVGTIAQPAFGAEIHEIPPNGQGIATLIALGLLAGLGIGADPVDDVATVHLMIEATKLALADVAAYVGDPEAMRVTASALLDPAYLAERAGLIDRDRAGDP